MVSSTIKTTTSLVISLLVMVISLTGVAMAAPPAAPNPIADLTRYTPSLAGAPGKMARDAAGNFYVVDFWGKGIVKLNSQGSKIGFIATDGRPSAVAAMPDGRLVVAVIAPQPSVAFYNQLGTAPNISGEKSTVFGAPTYALYRPSAITVDPSNYIYVIDAGDSSTSTTVNVSQIKVYDSTGAFRYQVGTRTNPTTTGPAAVSQLLKQASGIAYEKVGDKIWVADTLNGRIVLYSPYNGASMTALAQIGAHAGTTPPTVNSTPVTFGGPTDFAFEYNAAGTTLLRVYVLDKGRNEVSVLDATTNKSTMFINNYGTTSATIFNSNFQAPSGLLFEKTAAGGVLYVSSAATSRSAGIQPISIDSGSVVSGPALTMAAVNPSVTTATIALSGTVAGFAVTCSANGGIDVSAVGTTTWSISSIGLVSGANNIVCKSSDGTNTTYVQAGTYYTPTLGTAPTVTVAQPGTDVYTKNGTITVSGTSDTANATVQIVNTLNSSTVTTLTNSAKTWSAQINLSEGSNPIDVSVWRSGTNTGTAPTVTVVADYTVPVMTNSFLSVSATTNEAVQNVDGLVVDANISSTYGSVDVNGVAVPGSAKADLGAGLIYFSVPVTLVRGSNTINVTATDRAGNSSTLFTRTVTLNPEIPGLTVTLPADNTYMPGVSNASATGTVDSTFNSISAAGQTVTPVGTAWSTTTNFTVNTSLYPYLFTASGGGNTPVTVKRTIINSGSYSNLAVTSPAADRAVKTSDLPLTITGSVATGSPKPSVLVDGVAVNPVSVTYDSGTGIFSYSLPLATEAIHPVMVVSGASKTVRNIIYDSTAPELSMQADSKPAPMTITGTIEPTSKISAITASSAGSPVTIPLSVLTFDTVANPVVWTANLNGYVYDTISFTTRDPAGNEKTLPYAAGVPTGDIDGDGVVRDVDALACLRHIAGTGLLAGTPRFQADVGDLINGRASTDGIVDITDAVLILNKAYGLMAF